jgi:hypothetical protein
MSQSSSCSNTAVNSFRIAGWLRQGRLAAQESCVQSLVKGRSLPITLTTGPRSGPQNLHAVYPPSMIRSDPVM